MEADVVLDDRLDEGGTLKGIDRVCACIGSVIKLNLGSCSADEVAQTCGE
jgi:hypothetical protein